MLTHRISSVTAPTKTVCLTDFGGSSICFYFTQSTTDHIWNVKQIKAPKTTFSYIYCSFFLDVVLPIPFKSSWLFILSTSQKRKLMIVLPPKLRRCFLFIPKLKSGSSESGVKTPASQPIMAGTFSWRKSGKTPGICKDRSASRTDSKHKYCFESGVPELFLMRAT